MAKLGIICGGPSLERGISLNSARSAMDHIQAEITVYYVNPKQEVYLLDKQHLYSNTPQDFDFKIGSLAKPLTEEAWVSSMKTLDLIFPIIHGEFGEDGKLQSFLESHDIPFVGSSAKVCDQMFHKDKANAVLSKAGYLTLPCQLIEKDNWKSFLKTHQKIVMKPQAGGSSIGVSIVSSEEQGISALEMAQDRHMIAEAFCDGQEFTVIVLASEKGPVSLVPVEIDIQESGAFFDYRRKYLPTANTRWLCPPRFSKILVQKIQDQAEAIFTLFGMRDFIRMDGWVKNGEVIFSDINPISGMEQNSFIFLQASRIGLSHQELFSYILSSAARRYGLSLSFDQMVSQDRRPVAVLMGGNTEERQVSLMSGTNVWLKLRQSKQFSPEPYFLDKDEKVWALPYTFALTHTVEEISECLEDQDRIRSYMQSEVESIRDRLGLEAMSTWTIYPKVSPMSLDDFLSNLVKTDRLFFNALHGGIGEDGTLQKRLDGKGIAYNGSGPKASALGMDKYLFGKAVNQTRIPNLYALEKEPLESWARHEHFGRLIIKPRSMGCSYGVQMIENEAEFNVYTFSQDPKVDYIVEPFIETDQLYYEDQVLKIKKRTGWLELTMVVCQDDTGYHALYPSITVAVSSILSVEEKFQGGTGVNITPPPEDLISKAALSGIQKRFEKLSLYLGVKDYVRYDLFYHLEKDEIIVIEMNTLPALTPSTVLYHQMLATGYASSPTKGLERLLSLQLVMAPNT